MEKLLFTLGGTPVSTGMAALGGLALVALLMLVLLVVVWRGGRARAAEAAIEARRSAEAERRLADLLRVQSEMTGRMQTMSEIFGSRTSDLARLLSERIEASSHRVNQSMTETRQD